MDLGQDAGRAGTRAGVLDDGRVLARTQRRNQLRLQLGRHGDALSQAKALAENLALLSQDPEARAEVVRLLAFANLAELLKRRGALT